MSERSLVRRNPSQRIRQRETPCQKDTLSERSIVSASVRATVCQRDTLSERPFVGEIHGRREPSPERSRARDIPSYRNPLTERALVREIPCQGVRSGGSRKPQLKPRRFWGRLGAKVASKRFRKPCPIEFWSILEPKMRAKTFPTLCKINVKDGNDFAHVFARFLLDFQTILELFFGSILDGFGSRYGRCRKF